MQAGSTGNVLGGSGAPLFVTWNGQQYPIAHPTLKVTDRIEKAVVRHAIDAIEKIRDTLSPAEYAEQKADLNRQIRAEKHTTGKEMWAERMLAGNGQGAVQYLVWACLAEARESLPAADRAKVPEVKFADAGVLLRESHDAMTVVGLITPDFTEAVGAAAELTATETAALLSDLTPKALPTE